MPIDLLSAIATAAIGGLTVTTGTLYVRLGRLEDSLMAARTESRSMWLYCRKLIDLYLTHRVPGSPDPDPLPDFNA